MLAMAKAPSVTAGNTRFRQSPLPDVGNRPSQREQVRINMMPI
jgi:hypothetical protein